MDVPNTIRIICSVLAYALPAALMISNPELMTREELATRPRA
jgi:hypothetical protein